MYKNIELIIKPNVVINLGTFNHNKSNELFEKKKKIEKIEKYKKYVELCNKMS